MLHISDDNTEAELRAAIQTAWTDNTTTPGPPEAVTQVTLLVTEPSTNHKATTDVTVAGSSHATMPATVPPLVDATPMPNSTKSEV